MSDTRVEEIPVPSAVSAPGWDDFAAAAEVSSASERRDYGTPDVSVPAEQRLPPYLDPNDEYRILVARHGGRILARSILSRTRETPEAAWLDLAVHPDQRSAGIGSALHDASEELARGLGIRRLIAYAVSLDGPGERLVPPTGAGSVPRENGEVRFALARGWRLEQIARASRFALPPDPDALARLRAEAEGHADGYRLLVWSGATPEPLREGMAELMHRMTTDAPSAGLEEPAETWDADRIAEYDARNEAGPATFLTAAAEHVASGRLAGFTRFSVAAAPAPVHQWDTIVRREDRGHRLGMLLKVANLQELEARHPGHPSVLTWNAEENRPMLSVNEAVGFVPLAYEGAWRKDL